MAFPTELRFIESAEKALGVRLPKQLRTHLLASNGGEVKVANDVWKLCPVQDTSDKRHASRSANHIVNETIAARQWTGFPHEGIAIAENGTGDRLVLVPFEDDPLKLDDRVFLWNHETRKLVLVAHEFNVP